MPLLKLYPPMHALMDADAAGWTRHGHAALCLWRHVQGLHLSVPQKDPTAWHLSLSMQEFSLSVVLPRTDPRPVEGDLVPLLHDLNTWIGTLDLEPRHFLARQCAGWLAWHGQTGPYVVRVRPTQLDQIILRPNVYGGHAFKIVVPSAMAEVLQPELTRFWAKARLPDQEYLHVRLNTPPSGERRFKMEIPASRHAGMAMIHDLHPDLRKIPLPEPCSIV